MELTLLIGQEEVCLLSKILHYVSAEKSGNGFPLVRHMHHSFDLGKSDMLSAQLYLFFQALWSSGSENCEKLCALHLAVKTQKLHSK